MNPKGQKEKSAIDQLVGREIWAMTAIRFVWDSCHRGPPMIGAV